MRASWWSLPCASLVLLACKTATTSSSNDAGTTASAIASASTSPSTSASTALEPPVVPDEFDVAAIDRYVTAQVAAKELVGLSLAIMREGKVVLAKGYGEASRETHALVEPDTAFGIGSITKQFTCASIHLLAEEQKLSLDDKVAKYYPNATRAKDVTLEDLGSHVSGYPDYYPLDFVTREMQLPITRDELIARYATKPLDFEPRVQWSYSNTPFIILGGVVEKVSGKTFADFLATRIFVPIGMSHTFFEPKSDQPGIAVGYTSFSLGAPTPAPREGAGWIDAAGGIYASASDLLAWDLAFIEGKVLRPDSYRSMTTQRKLSNGRAVLYGCGIGVVQDGGEWQLRHTGAVSGFVAMNTMIPRTKSAVVMLSNRDDIDPYSVFEDVLSLVLKTGRAVLPKIDGPPPKDVVLALVGQLQTGNVDRTKLGAEYDLFLTAERLRVAKEKLAPLGVPTDVVVQRISERGGMQVATLAVTFGKSKMQALLYRTPDGKIQELLLR